MDFFSVFGMDIARNRKTGLTEMCEVDYADMVCYFIDPLIGYYQYIKY